MSEQSVSEEMKAIYAKLSAPFPEDAIQRTKGGQTGRGYDTTGIGYQFIVNRLNEVLGVGGHRVANRTMTVEEGKSTGSGRKTYDADCELTLQLGRWVNGEFKPFAEAIGDGNHNSLARGDARKGAYTNAFKKAAAFLGVGRQAYEGTLDDDNAPQGHAADAPGFSGGTSRTPAPEQKNPTTMEEWKKLLGTVPDQASFNAAWKRACEAMGEAQVQGALGTWARDVYDQLPAQAAAPARQSSGGGSGGGGGEVATDEELDGRYGDPKVFSDPKRWIEQGGESYKGRQFSECPADYLEALAEMCVYFAGRETDEKKRGYKLKDAKFARGWARRNRQQHAA